MINFSLSYIQQRTATGENALVLEPYVLEMILHVILIASLFLKAY